MCGWRGWLQWVLPVTLLAPGLMLAASLLAACSNSVTQNELCTSLRGSTTVERVQLRAVYVFGSMHHGIRLISPDCPDRVTYAMFVDAPAAREGSLQGRSKSSQLEARFYSPSPAGSRMYRVSGMGTVRPGRNEVVFYRVDDFVEVDNATRDKLFALSRQQ